MEELNVYGCLYNYTTNNRPIASLIATDFIVDSHGKGHFIAIFSKYKNDREMFAWVEVTGTDAKILMPVNFNDYQFNNFYECRGNAMKYFNSPILNIGEDKG